MCGRIDSVTTVSVTHLTVMKSGRYRRLYNAKCFVYFFLQNSLLLTLPNTCTYVTVQVTFALVLVTLAVIVVQTPLSGLVLLPLAVLYYFCQVGTQSALPDYATVPCLLITCVCLPLSGHTYECNILYPANCISCG